MVSGGLDSTTALAVAKSEGYELYALTFNYGQRHSAEIRAAKRVATAHGVAKHVVTEFSLRDFGGSALTADIEVPKDRSEAEMGHGIPVTYVPARNTIFLSFALGWAEVLGATDIFIGVNALDYSGYPDCRPEYIEAYENMANLATKVGVEGSKFKIRTPLMKLSKKEIVELGTSLGVDYAGTLTCYDASDDGLACGHCDACLLRLRGFTENGLTDPAPYRDKPTGVGKA